MLEVEQLTKSYPTPRGPLFVLTGIDLSLSPGEAASIVGPSGGGKSTLLYILGALEPPSSGRVRLDRQDPFDLGAKALAAFRNRQVGFIFQEHYLLPQCTVLENVLAPSLVTDGSEDFQGRARSLLDEVGLSDRADHRPSELSGGEKQRVAVARALVLRPSLLLCDEPTGNLDPRSAETVADLILRLEDRRESILIVVTHSTELAGRFRIQFELGDGKLVRR